MTRTQDINAALGSWRGRRENNNRILKYASTLLLCQFLETSAPNLTPSLEGLRLCAQEICSSSTQSILRQGAPLSMPMKWHSIPLLLESSVSWQLRSLTRLLLPSLLSLFSPRDGIRIGADFICCVCVCVCVGCVCCFCLCRFLCYGSLVVVVM